MRAPNSPRPNGCQSKPVVVPNWMSGDWKEPARSEYGVPLPSQHVNPLNTSTLIAPACPAPSSTIASARIVRPVTLPLWMHFIVRSSCSTAGVREAGSAMGHPASPRMRRQVTFSRWPACRRGLARRGPRRPRATPAARPRGWRATSPMRGSRRALC
jgi:hypothetical protein